MWSNGFETRPEVPKRAFVGNIRKDGKVPVTFVYPMSGRKITKLIPQDQVTARCEGYEVHRAR